MKHCKNNYTRECVIFCKRERKKVCGVTIFIKKIYGEDDGYDKI